VANTPNLFRFGAGGFIGWLGSVQPELILDLVLSRGAIVGMRWYRRFQATRGGDCAAMHRHLLPTEHVIKLLRGAVLIGGPLLIPIWLILSAVCLW